MLLSNKHKQINIIPGRYQKYGESLNSLKDEKVKVLEEVIETESFKNAKELLERFDPQSTFLRPTQQGKFHGIGRFCWQIASHIT